MIYQSTCFNSSWIVYIIPCVSFIQKTVHNLLYESKSVKYNHTDYGTIETQTSKIVHFISRDFIKSWYDLISQDCSFVNRSHSILTELKDATLHRLEGVSKYDLVRRFAVLYHKHLCEYHKAQHSFKIQPKLRLKRDRSHQFRRINSVIEAFESNSSFHIALQSSESEELYLRVVLDTCLKHLIKEELFKCRPGRDLLTEIISTNALVRLLELISDPSWLHYFIIKLTSDEDIEQVDIPEENASSDPTEQTLPTQERMLSQECNVNGENGHRDVDFFIDPEEAHIPATRPNPIGCSDPDIEVRLTLS